MGWSPQHFAVAQGWQWILFAQMVANQKVIDQTEYNYHERGNIHKETSATNLAHPENK